MVIISNGCKIFNLKLQIVGENSVFKVDQYASLRDVNVVIWEGQSVSIGKDCMLSYGVNIRTTDSHGIYDVITKQRINPSKSIIIGEHVWIGQNTTLLKGTSIGEHSVVGFGSTCTKDYPSNCIIAGSPAKVVKKDIDWDRELSDFLYQ